MDRLLNALKGHVGAMDAQLAQPRWGTVQNVDTATYRARVLIQPEGVLSGWLPIKSHAVGASWGMTHLPKQGQQVIVLPMEGSAENGVVLGLAYSTANPPPKSYTTLDGSGDATLVGDGEFLLKHADGAFMRFLPGGKVLIGGNVDINGDVHVNGDIFDKIGKLDSLRQNYDQHRHAGVQSGTATTGLTDQPDP